MVKRTNLWIVGLFLAGSLLLTSKAKGEENSAQELVDRLQEVIERAERDRVPRRALLQDLQGLVKQYYWPWRVRLLDDDFSDGDLEKNPAWTVDDGKFWVARGVGLRTREMPKDEKAKESRPADTAKKPAMEDAATAIFGALMGNQKDQAAAPAEKTMAAEARIHTKLRIPNAFAVKLNFSSRDPQAKDGHFEFGPYREDGGSSGYRLVYYPGRRPSFQLLRVSPGRSSVIEIHDQEMNLEGNEPHVLEWRRDTEGEMAVYLDGKEILRAVDRGSQSVYDGFALINRGGDYTFSRIAVFGSES